MYYIYIITNYTRSTLYIGMTNSLVRRIEEHKSGEIEGFSKRYNLRYLVYYEEFQDVLEAIDREKLLKKWNRKWKDELITDFNPKWRDLSVEL